MTTQSQSKTYPAVDGTLVIENIFSDGRPKTEIIRELIMADACPRGGSMLQSACRNPADCGSQTKEAGN